MTQKKKHHADDVNHRSTHIYQKPLGIRIVALLVGLPVAGFILTFLWDTIIQDVQLPADLPMIVFIVYGGVCMMYYGIHFSLKNRLVTSAKGIDLYYYGATSHVDWDNLSHFVEVAEERKLYFGIELLEPLEYQRGGYHALMVLAAILPCEYIPLSRFTDVPFYKVGFGKYEIADDLLLKTPLGRDLYHYAPHLFDDVKEKQP